MSEKTKKAVKRSPNFPGMNLENAILYAKKIYDADGRAGTLRATVLRHWGYKSEHGVARMTISALKKFNLIEEVENTVKLTRQAEIIFISKDENKIKPVIQECALSPTIYKKLWEQYSNTGFPSEASLRDKLIWEYDFNEKAVDGFLEDFKSTLEYAELKAGQKTLLDNTPDMVTETEEENNLDNNDITPLITAVDKQKSKVENRTIKEYLIPRKEDKLAMLKLEKPVTNEDIDLIGKWLELLRFTIVDNDEAENEQN